MDPARRASRDRGNFARGFGHRTSTRKFRIAFDHLCRTPQEGLVVVPVVVVMVVLMLVLAVFDGLEFLQPVLAVQEKVDFGGRKNKAILPLDFGFGGG